MDEETSATTKLPCGHRLCEDCCSSISKQIKANRRCPKCRESFVEREAVRETVLDTIKDLFETTYTLKGKLRTAEEGAKQCEARLEQVNRTLRDSQEDNRSIKFEAVRSQDIIKQELIILKDHVKCLESTNRGLAQEHTKMHQQHLELAGRHHALECENNRHMSETRSLKVKTEQYITLLEKLGKHLDLKRAPGVEGFLTPP